MKINVFEWKKKTPGGSRWGPSGVRTDFNRRPSERNGQNNRPRGDPMLVIHVILKQGKWKRRGLCTRKVCG